MKIREDLLVEALNREFPEHISGISKSHGFLTIETKKQDVKKIIHYLKDSTFDFNFLTDICGIHYPQNSEKELGVIYHLHSFSANFRLRVKVFFSKNDAFVESLTDLYASANWMERETYDFYGIIFNGHPDLRAILNMEDLGYHPLLKEHKLEDATRTDKDDKMFGR